MSYHYTKTVLLKGGGGELKFKYYFMKPIKIFRHVGSRVGQDLLLLFK